MIGQIPLKIPPAIIRMNVLSPTAEPSATFFASHRVFAVSPAFSENNRSNCHSNPCITPIPPRHRYSPAWYSTSITIRVRYPETDAMGYLRHSRFLQYFPKWAGSSFFVPPVSATPTSNAEGVFFVVVKAEIRYKAPAKYDDELTLITKVIKQTAVRLDHTYELKKATSSSPTASPAIAPASTARASSRAIPEIRTPKTE